MPCSDFLSNVDIKQARGTRCQAQNALSHTLILITPQKSRFASFENVSKSNSSHNTFSKCVHRLGNTIQEILREELSTFSWEKEKWNWKRSKTSSSTKWLVTFVESKRRTDELETSIKSILSQTEADIRRKLDAVCTYTRKLNKQIKNANTEIQNVLENVCKSDQEHKIQESKQSSFKKEADIRYLCAVTGGKCDECDNRRL